MENVVQFSHFWTRAWRKEQIEIQRWFFESAVLKEKKKEIYCMKFLSNPNNAKGD